MYEAKKMLTKAQLATMQRLHRRDGRVTPQDVERFNAAERKREQKAARLRKQLGHD